MDSHFLSLFRSISFGHFLIYKLSWLCVVFSLKRFFFKSLCYKQKLHGTHNIKIQTQIYDRILTKNMRAKKRYVNVYFKDKLLY